MVPDFNPETAAQAVANSDYLSRAKLFIESTQSPFAVQQMVFPLDTAQLPTNPLPINFPFRSLVIRAATDSAVGIDMRLFAMDAIQSVVTLRQNDALKFPYAINKAFLSWAAQPGKSITILFMVDGELSLGSINTTISGGVTLQEGTAIGAIQSQALVAATATIIAPALSTRKTCTLMNLSSGNLYYGGDNTVTDTSVVATQGIVVPPGGQFNYRNTAALWGYTTLAGTVNRLEET